MTTSAHKPLRIFCSYAHEDEEHLNVLREWLRGLERQGLIKWWHDRQIVPGWEWEEAIDKNLRTAEIILLLVTPDFMASDYVYEKEIDRAIERHERGEARVIPIIVRPSDWKWAPFGKLQALPKDARPITTWPNRDEAWLDVAEELRRAVEELSLERQERAAAEERMQRIMALYGQGQRHIDAEEWQQALVSLEEVQRLEPGYRETEELLSRVRQELTSLPTVEVPDLGGRRITQASGALAQKGLRIGAQNEIPSNTVPKGQIIDQSPEAGADMYDLAGTDDDYITKDQIGIAPLPAGPAGSVSGLGGRSFFISANSDAKDAALKFIKFATSTEQQKSGAIEANLLPTRQELYADQGLLDKVPVMDLGKEAILNAEPLLVSPHYSKMWPVMAKQFNARLKDEVSPEEAIKALQTQLTKIAEQ